MEFPLFETICIERGEVKNIALHQQRYERSLALFYRHMYPKSAVRIFDLLTLIEKTPEFSTALSMPLLRCRLAYNRDNAEVRFFPYQRKIYQRFQPIICDDIHYDLKYNDREQLNALFAQRGNCDEIIIIKQGKVTDCSIGNLVFRRNGQWFTPDCPLLNGTQRQKLLAEGKIRERTIGARELDQFDDIRLINAMNDLTD